MPSSQPPTASHDVNALALVQLTPSELHGLQAAAHPMHAARFATAEPRPEAFAHADGLVAWGARHGGQVVSCLWPWVEMGLPGAFAVADITAISANVRLVDERGRRLPAAKCGIELFTFVHGLPWQQSLLRALKRLDRRGAALAARSPGVVQRIPLHTLA